MSRFLYIVSLILLSLNSSIAQHTFFNEISDSIGLDYIYPGNDFQMAGGGVMIIDVNNDGWEDVFQSGGIFDSKLWINKNGKFVDGTAEYGLDVLKGYFIQGAISADYDNDGFQDFIILNYGTGMGRGDKKSPVILKNVNGTHFEAIYLDSILEPGNYTGASWGDLNHDGFSDLYLTNYVESMGGEDDEFGTEIGYDPICYRNKLLLNVGGKTFRECAAEYGVDDIGCGFATLFSDVDNDGNIDILLLNDFGEWTDFGNKFFRNKYPEVGFEDVSEKWGFNQKMYGMGVGPGDFNQDGKMDYYITNIGRNYLFTHVNGIFKDVAQELNLDMTYALDSIPGTSWSGLFFDADFDGDLDLYVSKGNVLTLVPKAVIRDHNQFFLNNNGIFENKTSESGMDDVLSHRGAAFFDFDHDGDLDVISSVLKLPLAAFAKLDQKIKFYENKIEAGNWIGIKLVGEDGINKDCFGCRILFEDDGEKMLKEVDGGSGHASQSTRILYFGLGTSNTLEKATIFWTNGEQLILKNLKKGSVYEVRPNGKMKKVF